MRKEYYDSILASFSRSEWGKMYKQLSLEDSHITNQFMISQGIERASPKRRKDYIKIQSPFPQKYLQSLFVSNPK